MKLVKRIFYAGVLCVLVFGMAGKAQAFRVTPMIVDLKPSGSEATSMIRVENTGSKELPVEVIVEKREINEDGSETRSSGENDFAVFPPQAVIPPGQAQAFRIQYIGDPGIAQSQGYLATISQVPVTFEEEQSGIQFAFQFGVSINVVPENARPEIHAISQNTGGDGLEVLVENSGNAYTRLTQGRWIFTNASGETHVLEGQPLRESIEQPLIQPQKTRRVILPVPASFKTSKVRIVYEPA